MAVANTFTPILRNLTTGAQRIARERIPLTRIAQTNWSPERAMKDQAITIPIVPSVAGRDFTRGAIWTESAARALGSTSITMTNEREFPFVLSGEDMLAMQQNPEYVPMSYLSAVRALANEVHSSLAGLHVQCAGNYASDNSKGAVWGGAAIGTAGTTPFASDHKDLTSLEKMLNDSLAPIEDRFFFIDTAAKKALGDLGYLFKANEAGSDDMLRRGIIAMLDGFNVVWSNDVKLGSTIAGSGYVTDGAQAVGATSIVVKTGTGAIPAGTVLSFAGDTANKYVVAAAYAGGAGTLTLTSGLVNAIADANAISLAAGRRNMAFHREAMGLAIRLPSLPDGGDAGMHSTIVDPESGLTFQVSKYLGKGENLYMVSALWGAKLVRPELAKILLG